MEEGKKKKPEKQSIEYLIKSFVAGGIAGCCAKTASAPLDRVKILFQANNPHFKEMTGSIIGAFRALKVIAVNDGLPGLFRGNTATLARIFPYAALQYMSYEQIKNILNEGREIEKPITRLLAGSAAGTISVLGTYPLDLTRTKLAYQVKDREFKNIREAIAATMRKNGIVGLYRGFIPTILGILPYAGVSFYTYEMLKSNTVRYYKEKGTSIPIMVRLSWGAVAGAIGQTVAYPLDVVRRRRQVVGLAEAAGHPDVKSTWKALRFILRTQGIRGLFIGLSINYIKVAPTTAISFFVYEQMKHLLHLK